MLQYLSPFSQELLQHDNATINANTLFKHKQPAVFFISESLEMELKQETWSPSFMNQPFYEQVNYREFNVQTVN